MQYQVQKIFIAMVVIDAALFVTGAIAHLGIPIGAWHETKIVGASVVEGAAALLLTAGLTGLLLNKAWGNWLSWAGLWFSFAGMLVGMLALAGGAAVRTSSNDYLHIGMVLFTTLALVLRARIKSTQRS